MSKTLVDKLLKEAYLVANDKWARSGIDKSKQQVRVSRTNLKNAFKEAFNKEHSEEFTNKEHPFLVGNKIDEIPFNKAADAAFLALRTYLDKPNTKGDKVSYSSQQIIFSMPRTLKTPITNLKKAGINSLNSSLKALNKKPLSESQELGIQKGLERLHSGSTAVGTGRLFYVLNSFKEDPQSNKFLESSEYKSLTSKYGDVFLDYEVIDTTKGRELRTTQTVSIYLAPKSKNFAGSESKDWKNIKPKLEKALAKWISTQSLEEQKGSKSPKEHITLKAEHLIMAALVKGKRVSGKVPKNPGKADRKKQGRKEKGVAGKQARTVKAKTYSPKTSKVSTTPSLASILGIINDRLPKQVAKNMGDPRLNYRTGRFAGSVRLTDVAQTAKGFPSIGYTYMKSPYQTFEPGFAQGSVDRDPRKIIDFSIREIAAGMAMGRFYTRRV